MSTRLLDFLVLADGVVERLPRGRSHLADQLARASTSIVLNIAEGAGKFSAGGAGMHALERVVSMLVALAKRLESSR